MTIWTPTRVGAIDLPHRPAMAPMTRDNTNQRTDGYGGDHRGYTDYPTLATAEH